MNATTIIATTSLTLNGHIAQTNHNKISVLLLLSALEFTKVTVGIKSQLHEGKKIEKTKKNGFNENIRVPSLGLVCLYLAVVVVIVRFACFWVLLLWLLHLFDLLLLHNSYNFMSRTLLFAFSFPFY